MLILLPPSETKRAGGSGSLDDRSLWAHDRLGEVRRRVRDALVRLSDDEDTAAKALKLGVKNRGELEHNRALDRAAVMPAVERYTGVLYDALDVQSLGHEARDWIDGHVIVQSALFGAVRAGDEIPAYRLSGGSRLPELGEPLKRAWSRAHAELDWGQHLFILDLRSNDYAALAPVPGAHRLQVVQRGADGAVRALNHFNKAAKGDLVRRLAVSGAEVADADAFADWAAGTGLETFAGPGEREITLVTELGAPGARS